MSVTKQLMGPIDLHCI